MGIISGEDEMNRPELTELLEKVAEYDLEEGSKLRDHPCSVAIRALDKCFDDINALRSVAPKKQGSERIQMLTGLSYNPSW